MANPKNRGLIVYRDGSSFCGYEVYEDEKKVRRRLCQAWKVFVTTVSPLLSVSRATLGRFDETLDAIAVFLGGIVENTFF